MPTEKTRRIVFEVTLLVIVLSMVAVSLLILARNSIIPNWSLLVFGFGQLPFSFFILRRVWFEIDT